MKKQINSVSNLSVKSIISVAILSAMLCTFNVKANNKPSVAQNTATIEKSENKVESWMNSNIETNYNAVEIYKPAEFVQSDMANEIASWMNSDDATENIAVEEYKATEFVQSDMTNEIASWMNTGNTAENNAVEEYNAANFVQADMTLEIESWMKSSGI